MDQSNHELRTHLFTGWGRVVLGHDFRHEPAGRLLNVLAVSFRANLTNRLARRLALTVVHGVALLLALNAALGVGEAAAHVGHVARGRRPHTGDSTAKGYTTDRYSCPTYGSPSPLGVRVSVGGRFGVGFWLRFRLRFWFWFSIGDSSRDVDDDE